MKKGRFDDFSGQFVPELLHTALMGIGAGMPKGVKCAGELLNPFCMENHDGKMRIS